jgi:putative restriction endonuclease
MYGRGRKMGETLSDKELIERFTNIRIWRRGDEYARHKPLLLLLALSRVQRGGSRLVRFQEFEEKIKTLLEEFGPRNKKGKPLYRAQYPFWRLQNDIGIWEIPEKEYFHPNEKGDVSVVKLREIAHGGFPEDIYHFLRNHPDVVNSITARILEDNFPSTLHEQILNEIGMPYVVETRSQRDPSFREVILRIYEHRCAVCGYNGRLRSSDLGLEAAHLKWHAAGGPDREDNGLALCSFHHVTLDRGAWGLDSERRILISGDVNGTAEVDNWLIRFDRKPLRSPQEGEPELSFEFIKWHEREVFRRPARRPL